jgi:hypothetical protein
VSILPEEGDKFRDAVVRAFLKVKSPRRKVEAAFEAGLFD